MSKWAEEFIEKYDDRIDKVKEWNDLFIDDNLNKGGNK